MFGAYDVLGLVCRDFYLYYNRVFKSLLLGSRFMSLSLLNFSRKQVFPMTVYLGEDYVKQRNCSCISVSRFCFSGNCSL